MGAENKVRPDDAGPPGLLARAGEARTGATAVILLSGGFDPIHSGHVDMIRHAARIGQVVVALNSDEWLYKKKGYFFMDYNERAAILSAMGCRVFQVKDTDGTVAAAIRELKPTYFGNGGDRLSGNPEESAACREVGCTELFGIGGGKSQSSSSLVARLWQRLHTDTMLPLGHNKNSIPG